MDRKRPNGREADKEMGVESADYRWRPDPDEPWRFRCPDCGSTDVNRKPTQTTEERRFECGVCAGYWPESELVDRAADRDDTREVRA